MMNSKTASPSVLFCLVVFFFISVFSLNFFGYIGFLFINIISRLLFVIYNLLVRFLKAAGCLRIARLSGFLLHFW